MPLYAYFEGIREQSYCIVKSYQLVDYPCGTDIDIFCFDIKNMICCITRVGQQYVQECGYEIVITNKGNHAFVDFYDNKELIIRFDLYGSIPTYKRVKVRDAYFGAVIENYSIIDVEFEIGKVVPVKVAAEQDDLILRYIEYIEYYLVRPDKVKHLEYIMNKLKEAPGKINYLDRLHYYTGFPNYEDSILFEKEIREESEFADKKARNTLREHQSKIDSVEERYQRLLKVVQTDFSNKVLPEQFIIYGAGNIGKVFYDKVKEKCKVEYFIDMYSKEREYEGISILSLQEISDINEKKIIVIPMYDFNDIRETLLKIYGESTTVIPLDDLIK